MAPRGWGCAVLSGLAAVAPQARAGADGHAAFLAQQQPSLPLRGHALGQWHVDAWHEELRVSSPAGVEWVSPAPAAFARVRSFAERMTGFYTEHKVLRTDYLGQCQLARVERADARTLAMAGRLGGDGPACRVELAVDGAQQMRFVARVAMRQAPLLPGMVSAPGGRAFSLNGSEPIGWGERHKYATAELAWSWRVQPRERIVGGGEQYSYVNLAGRRLRIWASDNGIGRGWQDFSAKSEFAGGLAGDETTTYSAVPAFLSSRGYAVVLDNPELVVADFEQPGLASTTVSFQHTGVPAGEQDFALTGRLLVSADASLRGLVSLLTAAVTGRMHAPPEWTQTGLVVGTEGGHAHVARHLEILSAHNVSLAGAWIQDWSGVQTVPGRGDQVVWNWQLDETMYPKQWLRDVALEYKVKVLTYANDRLTVGTHNVYAEAERRGFLVKNSSGLPLLRRQGQTPLFGTVDLFNRSAFEWWSNTVVRCNVLMACDDGVPLVHGFMNDYADDFPVTAAGHAMDVHNRYTALFTAAAAQGARGLEDVLFFSRSGNLTSPSLAPMFWLGDQNTNLDACDGVQSAMIAMMSSGFTGWSITHADIGAFTEMLMKPWDLQLVRTDSMLVRSMEVSVFTNALFRSHPGLVGVLKDPDMLCRVNVQPWCPRVIQHTRDLTTLFVRLAPYRKALFEEAEKHGWPLVRHGLLVRPEDPAWFNATKNDPEVYTRSGCEAGNEIGLSQFFWGDDVIVAPVVFEDLAGPNKTRVWAYLPDGGGGAWEHCWTSRQETGPSYSSWPAPLGQPAFFFHTGSRFAALFRTACRASSSR